MKKYFPLVVVLAFTHSLYGQFSVSSPNNYLHITNESDIDAVFLFDGIDATTEISYNGTANFEWRRYDNSFVANTRNFSPDNASGYILYDKTNNTPVHYIWVIDYSLYPIALNSVAPDGNCQKLTLNTDFDIPELVYYDKNNTRKTLKRTFTVSYTDYIYKDSTWQDEEKSSTHTAPFTQIELDAPKKNVTICIVGDNFAKEMNLSEANICFDYTAVAVESHIKATIEKRSGTNEYLRDNSVTGTIRGSGPLVVYLENQSNTPVVAFYEWKIYRSSTPENYFRYSEENIRYSFNETGDYTAVLKVLNGDGSCFSEDSVKINVLESLLEVPNAFSPNGDGFNEEFRVVFKSLNTYKITIFNRWGRVVYQSTDPSKGWDGRIGRSVAAAGTYYYVIEATGTDRYSEGKHKGRNIMYNLKGHINLFK